MANVPKPQRKSANPGNDNLARPTGNGGVSKANYKRQSVAPFSNPGKGAYVRKPSGVSPDSVRMNSSDTYQPHNNGGSAKVGKMAGGSD